jgi:hypothetical protein
MNEGTRHLHTSTKRVGGCRCWPPNHCAVMSAFIHLPIGHHLDLDVKLIEDNFLPLLCLKRVTMFSSLLGKMLSREKNGMQQYAQRNCSLVLALDF